MKPTRENERRFGQGAPQIVTEYIKHKNKGWACRTESIKKWDSCFIS